MSAAREVLADALRGRYSLEREVGRGGMATVYLARGVERGEAVAVKAMHPALASALGKRFSREMAVAGSLDHPLIVPLYGSGTAGHVPYYIMPYVEGETLHARLWREGRLSLVDTLRITHDVAEALGYAHGRGVLHRDVKPENILLSEGRALIADFGLARAIGAADSEKLTATGVVVGTAYYMSPEQLLEERNLDQRADIYSLGCVLYEMLAGAPPFTGATLTEVATRILRAPAPSIREPRPEVPESVDRAIRRALAKPPGERFETMADFAAALPRPAEVT